MDLIKNNDNVLLVWDSKFDPTSVNITEIKKNKNATINFENAERLLKDGDSRAKASFDLIICKATEDDITSLHGSLLKLLKPSGSLFAAVPTSGIDVLKENLKLTGFININEAAEGLACQKPNYEIGSASKLSFGKLSIDAAWKIDNTDEEIVNADDLLDETDKEKPDPLSLKVCGTTGKRKACKDCSCGLAEELSKENQFENTVSNNVKSSCGSCYLGDAFRCASCPYLGMPAFKPGEKIQLAGGLLNDDI